MEREARWGKWVATTRATVPERPSETQSDRVV